MAFDLAAWNSLLRLPNGDSTATAITNLGRMHGHRTARTVEYRQRNTLPTFGVPVDPIYIAIAAKCSFNFRLQGLIRNAFPIAKFFREFAQAMPDEYKDKCPVKAYRAYYRAQKMRDKNNKPMDFWTNRERPEWLNTLVQ